MILRILFLFMVVVGSALSGASVPSGFAETQIATSLDPSAMAFAPDGRLFVLEKIGRVRVIKNNALLADSFMDISSSVNNSNERGLIGLAFHPQFSTNGW
jgi:glucose/arabinose dehydrogenase